MIWPPAKAWTSKMRIKGENFFVAVNYEILQGEKWVDLVSVMDSNIHIKVSWRNMQNQDKWFQGWDENYRSSYDDTTTEQREIKIIPFAQLTIDSGLTIPISKRNIRPWFYDN